MAGTEVLDRRGPPLQAGEQGRVADRTVLQELNERLCVLAKGLDSTAGDLHSLADRILGPNEEPREIRKDTPAAGHSVGILQETIDVLEYLDRRLTAASHRLCVLA